ncbi:30S ribosomal protein S12 methylthiotransferase RimO [bacterium]|nr:30S ribosomal protein S12 methylthiotransferase RimO [bacterium]
MLQKKNKGKSNPIKKNPRVCLISLGCPKNQVDSEHALGAFQDQGFVLEAEPEKADVLIINTCAFIRSAEEETIQAVLEAAQVKKTGRARFLLVVGCWVSKYSENKLRHLVPEIDAVAPPGEISQWVQHVQTFFQTTPGSARRVSTRPLLSNPGTAYLKIAEGCSRRCAFCIIPRLRGNLQSRPMEALVSEARRLVRDGVLEIILIAQDTTSYGCDIYGKKMLPDLLRQLVRIPKLRWLRVMYTNPDGIDQALIGLLASEKKLCSYVDMPLQHVHPKILRAMRRPGNARTYLQLIYRLRTLVPGIVLRTTLLCGFPGETEKEHLALRQFIQTAQFDRLGVFAFSPEAGTRAVELPHQVHPKTRERRRRELMEQQLKISRERLARRVGGIVECLVEEPSGGKHCVGRTVYDAPEVDGGIVLTGKAPVGSIVRARITGSTDHDLEGVVL